MRMHDFDRPLKVAVNPGKRKSGTAEPEPARGGFFWTGLTDELRESLAEYARRAAKGARADGRVALKEQDAARVAHREERVIGMLNKHVEQYAYAKELFAAWAKPDGQRTRSKQAIQQALHTT